jgi:FixJ family two-component response regulator
MRVSSRVEKDRQMTDHPTYTHNGIGVSLVDGDPAIRRARQIMLLSERYDVRSYATGAALLADPRSRDVPCIVVDIAEQHGSDHDGMDILYEMRASGWRGKAILLDGGLPRPALVHAAERHGDRILGRAVGDAPLLAAIAASVDHGWSRWNPEG